MSQYAHGSPRSRYFMSHVTPDEPALRVLQPQTDPAEAKRHVALHVFLCLCVCVLYVMNTIIWLYYLYFDIL